MMGKIRRFIKLKAQNYMIHKCFPNTQIRLTEPFNLNRLTLGKYSYGDILIIAFNNSSNVKIGNYCSIAQEVRFIIDADHSIHTISTYPFKVKMLHSIEYEALSKGDIIVDDDVWIGYGATIMSGIHIGQGTIVGAGAVVTKDIPPYAIVGGIPAKVIKYRFSDEMIRELLKVDYSKLTNEIITEHINELYQELTNVNQIDWMPKKED